MLRWVGHKFWEIFCTNNCFIFRETACLTFVKQNLDNEIHFFVSSPFALRHTKQQQMVFSFASWRFLYLFFYKFYLNTTVENLNIRWIDLTNNKAVVISPCDILTGNRCHICPSVVSPSPPLLPPMSPPTPEGNVWSSDDTWHVPPLPLLSLQTTHTLKSQASSLVATWLPEPSLTPLRPWLMHDVLIRASLGNFQLMSGLHEYSRQIWFSIPATSLLLTAHRCQLLRCSEKWDDEQKIAEINKTLMNNSRPRRNVCRGFSSPLTALGESGQITGGV